MSRSQEKRPGAGFEVEVVPVAEVAVPAATEQCEVSEDWGVVVGDLRLGGNGRIDVYVVPAAAGGFGGGGSDWWIGRAGDGDGSHFGGRCS